jgi:hypothetical protein
MQVDDLLSRARQALTQLQFLSEARAATPPDKKHGGQQKASSRAPSMNGQSEYDFHFTGIERMVAAAERGVEIARKRDQKRAETVKEFRARIVREYKDDSAQLAADIEGVSRSYIEKIRAEAGGKGKVL